MADEDIDLESALKGALLDAEAEDAKADEAEQAESQETEAVDNETAEETESDDTESQGAETESQDDASTDEEAESSEATAASQDTDHAYYSAMKDERRKRQELEARLKELESQSEGESDKDFWEDPEGRFAQERQRWQQQLENQRLDMSEQMARQQYDDMDDRLEEFKGLMQSDPSLYQKVMGNPHPWLAMAQEVDKSRNRKGFDDADEYLKSKEAEIEKRISDEVEKRLSDKSKDREDKAKSLPGSAADIPQSASQTRAQQEAAAAEPSLDDALRG